VSAAGRLGSDRDAIRAKLASRRSGRQARRHGLPSLRAGVFSLRLAYPAPEQVRSGIQGVLGRPYLSTFARPGAGDRCPAAPIAVAIAIRPRARRTSLRTSKVAGARVRSGGHEALRYLASCPASRRSVPPPFPGAHRARRGEDLPPGVPGPTTRGPHSAPDSRGPTLNRQTARARPLQCAPPRFDPPMTWGRVTPIRSPTFRAWGWHGRSPTEKGELG